MLWHFMPIIFWGDNLHEMSAYLVEKYLKTFQIVISWHFLQHAKP